ncbi:MAG TPA: proton-conducting transporter membrane subunit [Anaerolineales bacterium]|nr:proton-conducting transporter membrane subunit [Anaerolineales bacterium]
MNASMFPWMIGLPLGASPLVYLAGRLGAHKDKLNEHSWLVRGISLLALLVTWVLFIVSWSGFVVGGANLQFNLESIWLHVDGLSFLLAAMTLGLGTLVVLFSWPYIAEEVGEEKFYAMLLAMIGIMIGLGCTNDLFNLWMWFEAMAVSSYLLVAFYRERPASLEAGAKYLVQSATGSVLVLLGIALVLANTGTLALDQIQRQVSALSSIPTGLLLAGALFIIGFGVKVAFVPLHTWLPDAHSQAPSGISAMLSGVVIEAGLVAMLRALSALGGFAVSWGTLLLAFGALNMFFGNLMALRQTQVKRMLAYSSLSHMGYILLGLGIALYDGNPAGAQGAAFHLFNHTLMKGLAFLAVGALMFALLDQHGNHRPLEVNDLAGAARKYPLVGLTLSIALLALGGLPPLAGFMSKWQIFVAGFQGNNGWLIGLVIFAALNSVLSLAYYAPIVNVMYRRKMGESVEHGAPIPLAMNIPLVILAAAIVVIGLWPSIMNWLTEPAAQAFLSMFGK